MHLVVPNTARLQLSVILKQGGGGEDTIHHQIDRRPPRTQEATSSTRTRASISTVDYYHNSFGQRPHSLRQPCLHRRELNHLLDTALRFLSSPHVRQHARLADFPTSNAPPQHASRRQEEGTNANRQESNLGLLSFGMPPHRPDCKREGGGGGSSAHSFLYSPAGDARGQAADRQRLAPLHHQRPDVRNPDTENQHNQDATGCERFLRLRGFGKQKRNLSSRFGTRLSTLRATDRSAVATTMLGARRSRATAPEPVRPPVRPPARHSYRRHPHPYPHPFL